MWIAAIGGFLPGFEGGNEIIKLLITYQVCGGEGQEKEAARGRGCHGMRTKGIAL